MLYGENMALGTNPGEQSRSRRFFRGVTKLNNEALSRWVDRGRRYGYMPELPDGPDEDTETRRAHLMNALSYEDRMRWERFQIYDVQESDTFGMAWELRYLRTGEGLWHLVDEQTTVIAWQIDASLCEPGDSRDLAAVGFPPMGRVVLTDMHDPWAELLTETVPTLDLVAPDWGTE